jgi:hypothetical protein
MQCVANSARYVAASIGGLQAMKWKARRRRRTQAAPLAGATIIANGTPATR